jgi:hypothetical protein
MCNDCEYAIAKGKEEEKIWITCSKCKNKFAYSRRRKIYRLIQGKSRKTRQARKTFIRQRHKTGCSPAQGGS